MGWLEHRFDIHQLSDNYLLGQFTHTSYFMCIIRIRLLCIFLPQSKTSSPRVENSNTGNYSPCKTNPSAARFVTTESLQACVHNTFFQAVEGSFFSESLAWAWNHGLRHNSFGNHSLTNSHMIIHQQRELRS